MSTVAEAVLLTAAVVAHEVCFIARKNSGAAESSKSFDRMAESSTPPGPSGTGQEFIVRAPGALHQGVDYFLGKFPQGFSEFKKKREGWHIHRQAEDKSVRRRGPEPKKDRPLPLVLEDQPGHITHTGQPEGGISGSGVGMTYFVLVKEGPHFTALPVKDWYNFRPSMRNQAMSLEDAEKQMNSRGAVRLNVGSKLGALAAKAEAEGAEVMIGDEEGEQPDSDEERENQRVARVRAANAEVAKGRAADGGDEDMPSAKVHTDTQEKGEDWEHEEERADDDLEQGDEEGSDQDVPTTGKKERIVTSDGDSDGEGNRLSDAQQELRRVLQKTHLSSGSEDGEGPSSSGRTDDDDEDIDLDEMASDLLPKRKARETSPSVRGKKVTGEQPKKGGEKRKASTPPVKAEAKKAKPAAKPKVNLEREQVANTPVVKQEPKAESSTQSEATSGPPSAREILDALKAWGPITTGELTSRFRKRLATQHDKQAFMGNVKKVSKLEERPLGSGKKFVVPK